MYVCVQPLSVGNKPWEVGMNKSEVTLVSAAAHLRVSWHTAYRLMLTGALPGQQRKGRWYVVQADVERLAAEQTHEQEGTEP